ncbi:MAG TPA: hypothetical protein VIT91_00300 [Chthoniobacterales bacterium]
MHLHEFHELGRDPVILGKLLRGQFIGALRVDCLIWRAAKSNQ